MNVVEQQEYLKKLDMNTQMKMLQLFGIRRFFDDQPKSPTETPPEKQSIIQTETSSTPPPLLSYAETITNANRDMEESAEMKNLATLCSAAAAAAAVATTPQNIEAAKSPSATDFDRQQQQGIVSEYDENEAALEADVDNIAEQEIDIEIDADDDEDDADGDADDDDEEDGEDDDDVEDDDDEDEDNEEDEENEETDRVNEGDGAEVDEEEIELNSPTKSRKLSNRLENLILSNVTLKPDDLTQALCDFREDLTGTDLVHVFPQMGNFKPTAANTIQQQFVQTQQQQLPQHKNNQGKRKIIKFKNLFDPVNSTATFMQHDQHFCLYDNPDDESIGHCEMYPALDESLEQFANDDDGTREQMYDIAVEMDEIFQVIHNVNDPSLQVRIINLFCRFFCFLFFLEYNRKHLYRS